MIQIPLQLQNPEFRFVLLKPKTKIPFEKNWQKEGYKFDDPKLLKHLEAGGNYGVLGGFGKLLIVDFDREELAKEVIPFLPKTFTVVSGGKGSPHKYFFCDDTTSWKVLDNEENTLVDVQGEGKQCVGAGSEHESGRRYKILNDAPIAEIDIKLLKELLLPYDAKTRKDMKPKNSGQKERDPEVENLRKKLTISDLLSRYGIPTNKNPTECPFHSSERRKCLSYTDVLWHCFHCDRGGDVFNFIMEKDNCDFPAALEKTREILGIKKEVESIQPSIHLFSDEELMQHKPDPQKWWVENYIPKRGISILSGKRASYKSWGALYIAISISEGKPVFGKFKTEIGRVLFVDEENGIDGLQEKIGMIKRGLNIENSCKNIKYSIFEGLRLDNYSCRVKFEEVLNDFKPEIIIVDSFRRIMSCDENDATSVNNFLTEVIRPITEKYGVSWILLHHLRKGISSRTPTDILDELRGSSEFVNYADSVLVFQRQSKSQNRFVLEQGKCRRAAEQAAYIVEIDWKEDSISMNVVGTAEEILTDIDLCARDIMVWLEENNLVEFQTKNVRENIHNRSKATQDRALSLLVGQGKLFRPNKGRYIRSASNLEKYVKDESKTLMTPESKTERVNNESVENKPIEPEKTQQQQLVENESSRLNLNSSVLEDSSKNDERPEHTILTQSHQSHSQNTGEKDQKDNEFNILDESMRKIEEIQKEEREKEKSESWRQDHDRE